MWVATRIAYVRETVALAGIALSRTEGLYPFAKRALGITVCLILVIAAFPLMLVIALAITLDSPGRVLFRQKRVLGGAACRRWRSQRACLRVLQVPYHVP